MEFAAIGEDGFSGGDVWDGGAEGEESGTPDGQTEFGGG